MGLATLSPLGMLSKKKRPDPGPYARPRFRPTLEGLEDRVTPASLPLAVDSINVDDGQIQAVVSLAGQATDIVDINLSTTAGADCTVLNLELAPINLNLLGLHVDTSAICLSITGDEEGGILGDLVCGLAGGLDLGGILGNLTGQLDTLIGQLDQLLDEFLGGAFNVTGVLGQGTGTPGGTQDICTGDCEILDLALGPVDLTLLGLNVHLDNCDDGPVQVCVSASEGEGLLGDLLCGLAGGIDLPGGGLGGLIGRVEDLVGRLTDLAERLGDLEDLDRFTNRIERLVDRLERFADRVDNIADLGRFLDQIDRTLDQLDRILDRL